MESHERIRRILEQEDQLESNAAEIKALNNQNERLRKELADLKAQQEADPVWPEWPQDFDTYWFVDDKGEITSDKWRDTSLHVKRHGSVCGIHRTASSAEEIRDGLKAVRKLAEAGCLSILFNANASEVLSDDEWGDIDALESRNDR